MLCLYSVAVLEVTLSAGARVTVLICMSVLTTSFGANAGAAGVDTNGQQI